MNLLAFETQITYKYIEKGQTGKALVSVQWSDLVALISSKIQFLIHATYKEPCHCHIGIFKFDTWVGFFWHWLEA